MDTGVTFNFTFTTKRRQIKRVDQTSSMRVPKKNCRPCGRSPTCRVARPPPRPQYEAPPSPRCLCFFCQCRPSALTARRCRRRTRFAQPRARGTRLAAASRKIAATRARGCHGRRNPTCKAGLPKACHTAAQGGHQLE